MAGSGAPADGSLSDAGPVAGGARESIVQPAWSPDNRLYFVSDRSGWWNLYRADAGGASPVCLMSAEFAGPACFRGEQHGFRKAETIQTVLRAELAFYGRIFGFTPADGLADLAIDNL